jgi:hypothetical protein
MHSGRPAACVFKLEQPLVQLFDTPEQLAGLTDLTGIPKGVAALDQSEHFPSRFSVEPDPIVQAKGIRN